MSEDQTYELHELRREVAELRQDVRGLLEAWRTAQGVVRFVKWVGAMATGITAIWALVKMGGKS